MERRVVSGTLMVLVAAICSLAVMASSA